MNTATNTAALARNVRLDLTTGEQAEGHTFGDLYAIWPEGSEMVIGARVPGANGPTWEALAWIGLRFAPVAARVARSLALGEIEEEGIAAALAAA